MDRGGNFVPRPCRYCERNNIKRNFRTEVFLGPHFIIECGGAIRVANQAENNEDRNNGLFLLKDIPQHIEVKGVKFKLVGCGVYNGHYHFIAYVNIGLNWIEYDDVKDSPEYVDPNVKHDVFILFYVREEE